ncbi:macrophage mannose receptor 1-like [Paralichthys olivaceus]|uniref:macrophage mannose receptor 1-like n=1 Tax=Paralichthys olivaceus TaxID=8255 RepID=UPI0037524D49
MQWSLFPLILMGQCLFVMCRLYEYHFIEDKFNWTAARNYCRSHYTDLATAYNEADVTEMKKLNKYEAWIGLYNTLWSQPGVEFSGSETTVEHEDDMVKNCVFIENSVKKKSDKCNEKKKFICYEDKIKLIKQNKTWQEAMDYCREHHNDLISITDVQQQRWVQERAKNAQTEFIWLGLRYTCTLDMWFWVTGEDFIYDNWESCPPTQGCYSGAAMKTDKGYKWVTWRDNETFNFICTL